ncbi:MAG: preprotein translocase subunit TatB [Clostridia bacterium]|nr:sulfurtransferase TusA family protein [Candidatus Pelethousia sp.]NCB30537.1 preprotein translocase subunit TatB [Clostridia bacterium]
MKQVDARGRACPEPVLLTKQALKVSPEGIEVLVDNAVALGNVTRFAQNAGYQVHSAQGADDTHTLTISK